MEYPLGKGLVQHLSVPFLEALGFGDLLIGRVTVEDVVITFARRTRPNVSSHIAAEGNQKAGLSMTKEYIINII